MEVATKNPAPSAEHQERDADYVLYPRGVDSARVIQVVETAAMRGSGQNGQTARRVVQYWSLDGKFLAERDFYDRGILAARSKANSDSIRS